MLRAVVAATVLASLAGCGDESALLTPPPAPAAESPEEGARVVLPAGVRSLELFDSSRSLRAARAMKGAGMIGSEEWRANDARRMATLHAGDSLIVRRIGEDEVEIADPRDERGQPVKMREGSRAGASPPLRGFVSPWWDADSPRRAVGEIVRRGAGG